MGKAIVLFGHGSRDPLWRLPMETVAARLRTLQPDTPVRCAYLELDQPDLRTAASELVAGGASRVTVVPRNIGTTVTRLAPPATSSDAAVRRSGWSSSR